MPARDIPGFYYDEAKGKYFRILPKHLAPPGLQNPRQHRKDDNETEQQGPQTCQNQRSRLLEHPLGGRYGLRREMGILLFQNLPTCRGAAWAFGLDRLNQINDKCRVFCYDSALDTYWCSTFDEAKQRLTYASYRWNEEFLTQNGRQWPNILAMKISPNRFRMILSTMNRLNGHSSAIVRDSSSTIYLKALGRDAEIDQYLDLSGDAELDFPHHNPWVRTFSEL